jgi:hypothetical protein
MCVCVCMYACIRACGCAGVCVCERVCLFVSVCVHVHVCASVLLHVCFHACVCGRRRRVGASGVHISRHPCGLLLMGLCPACRSNIGCGQR